MEKLGKEPEYTNWARIREEPEFKETLDYIFYSKVRRAERERSGERAEWRGSVKNI